MTSTIPTVIRVGKTAEGQQVNGLFFSGENATAHEVALTINPLRDVLEIRGSGQVVDWHLSDVRLVPDQAGRQGLVLRAASDPTARVLTNDRALAQGFPALHKRIADAPRARLAKWAVAALASVALIIFVLVPIMANQLANFIPPAGEKALGDATLEQIKSALGSEAISVKTCTNADGLAALNQMQTRLSDHADLPVPLTVTVLDHKMVNAFALPGGHVVFMRGLIDEAEAPEEVAAVFAHEIGHVVSRDPTRHALRSAGSIGVLGLLFGDFAGGALVLFLTEQLIEAQYSQGAEVAADTFAHDVLAKAEVEPAALGAMFKRLKAKYGDADGIQAHFISHPRMAERIEAADHATPEGFVARPILTAEAWKDLQGICN